jgi:hypothetical protein
MLPEQEIKKAVKPHQRNDNTDEAGNQDDKNP